ncbi:hypothetical protein F4825DRAFT_432727 [Nemania diffusa]|nr:hypothetical protein F4825DRAFT_432727 [Nemania diffusa]
MAVSKRTGEKFFPSEFVYSPDPRNDKVRQERYVQMERYRGPDEASETRYVSVHQRAEYEADGWQLWEVNPEPLDENGIDKHPLTHFRDTTTARKPWEETALEFVEGIKKLHIQAAGTETHPRDSLC